MCLEKVHKRKLVTFLNWFCESPSIPVKKNDKKEIIKEMTMFGRVVEGYRILGRMGLFDILPLTWSVGIALKR